MYNSTAQAITGDPNGGESFNLATLPSDATAAKTYGGASSQDDAESGTVTLSSGKKYVVRGVDSTDEVAMADTTHEPSAASIATALSANSVTIRDNLNASVTSGSLASAQVITVTSDTTVAQTSAEGNILTTAFSETSTKGKALTVGTLSADDASRFAGTYRVTIGDGNTTTDGSGTGTFDITVTDSGATSVEIVDGGKGHATTNTITVTAAGLGGAGASFTFKPASITADASRVRATYEEIDSTKYTYTNSSGDAGSGSGAVFEVSVAADNSASVRVVSAGSGYANGDKFEISGTELGNPAAAGLTFSITTSDIGEATSTSVKYAEVNTGSNAFQSGQSYVIQSLGTSNSTGNISEADSDALIISRAFTNEDGTEITENLSVGQTITMASLNQVIGTRTVTQQMLDAANALIEGMTFTRPTETLTAKIEAVQSLFNRARVEAGSQYAAMESAVSYTTDLTAQYELGFNTVNDVNFSAETAHLAKNQILQQAATAMLAQANSGQQGLLQLIQG